MANTDLPEWRLLDVDLVTTLGILPSMGGGLYLQLNEPGSGDLRISLNAAIASSITTGQYAQLTYRGSVRGGFFIENINKINANADEGGGQVLSISGRGSLALLDDAIVWDDGTTATARAFTAVPMGSILKTLIDEAKVRGALSILTYDFTASLDSDGNSWTDSQTMQLNVGMSMLDVVRQFANLGIDFNIVPSGGNFLLSAHKNGVGTNKASTIYLRVGMNCMEVASTQVGTKIKNAIRVKYSNGYTTQSDSTSISSYRRRESLLDASYAGANSTFAATFGAAELALDKDPALEIAVKVYDGVQPYAFDEYIVGDTIRLDRTGTEESRRVHGMQLNFNIDSYAEITLDLNSSFLENSIRMAQDINWLRNRLVMAQDDNQLPIDYWAAPGFEGDSALKIYAVLISGTYVYLGGSFSKMGGVAVNGFVRYDIATGDWTGLGFAGAGDVRAICIVGTTIYVAGNEATIWKYASGSWSSAGTVAFLGLVHALATDGTNLYAGGTFDDVNGVANTKGIARYDGSWHSLDSTDFRNTYALLYSGGLLYAGGTNSHIRSWNGLAWSNVGGTFDADIQAIVAYGTGLLAGGKFTNKIKQWDGASWAAFGGGLSNTVWGIAVYLADVYAVGDFTTEGNYIAKYTGAGWMKLLGGLNSTTRAIAIYTGNGVPDVYVGGDFTTADSKPARMFAVYLTSFQSIASYLENSSLFDLGAAIHNATAKSPLVAADEFGFWDSVSAALRKITWANLVASIYGTANRVLITANSTGYMTTDARLNWDPSDRSIVFGDSATAPIAGGRSLHIVGDSQSVGHILYSYTNTLTTAPFITGVHAGGSLASPSKSLVDMVLMRIRARGWYSTYSNTQAELRMLADEDWNGATNLGTRIEFHTTPKASGTLTKVLTLGSNGTIIPQIMTSDPSSPADGALWLYRASVAAIPDGTPMGLLLALTYTSNAGATAPLQLSVNDGGTTRRVAFA